MLTPNDVRARKARIRLRLDLTSYEGTAAKERMMTQLHVEVLEEIAKGSIDPKSLAMAVLEEKND